jgi:hypothetical protein
MSILNRPRYFAGIPNNAPPARHCFSLLSTFARGAAAGDRMFISGRVK